MIDTGWYINSLDIETTPMLIPRKYGRVPFGELRSLIELAKRDPHYVGRIIYGLLTYDDYVAEHYAIESLRGSVCEGIDIGELVEWFVRYGHWFYTWVKSVDDCSDELIIDLLARVALCLMIETSASLGFQEGVGCLEFDTVWTCVWDCYNGETFWGLCRLRSEEDIQRINGRAALSYPPTRVTIKDIEGPIDVDNESFDDTPYQPSKGFFT